MIIVLLVLAISTIALGNEANFKSSISNLNRLFAKCDVDESDYIDKDEFYDCFIVKTSQYDDARWITLLIAANKENPMIVFQLLDKNRDNLISNSEFITFVNTLMEYSEKTMNSDEWKEKEGKIFDQSKNIKQKFTVKRLNGEEVEMSSQDVFQQMREQMKNMKLVDGKIVKEEENVLSDYEKVREKDPLLSRFIQISNWTATEIIRNINLHQKLQSIDKRYTGGVAKLISLSAEELYSLPDDRAQLVRMKKKSVAARYDRKNSNAINQIMHKEFKVSINLMYHYSRISIPSTTVNRSGLGWIWRYAVTRSQKMR